MSGTKSSRKCLQMCLGRRAGLVCQPAESWLHLEEMTMTPPPSKYRILRRGALLLIIATFAVYNEVELVKHEPDLIYVDSQNRIVRRGHKIPVQAAA